MIGSGILRETFFSHMSSHTRQINVLPSELETKPGTMETIYPEIQDSHPIRFQKMARELNESDHSAYNVVVLGPTGSGKSTIINHIFNKTVCETSASAQSCTREVRFYRGVCDFEMMQNGRRVLYQKMINIIDTIGNYSNLP